MGRLAVPFPISILAFASRAWQHAFRAGLELCLAPAVVVQAMCGGRQLCSNRRQSFHTTQHTLDRGTRSIISLRAHLATAHVIVAMSASW